MNRFFRDLMYLVIAGVILWIFFPRWFGINIPLTGKDPPTKDLLRNRIWLPKGFSITVYANGLPNVRILHFTKAGDLLASLPRSGRIVLLQRDADGDGISDNRLDLLAGLNKPHGIDIHDDWLYVAETNAIGRILFNGETGKTHGEFERIVIGLPGGGNHWSRTVGFGPDAWMYVSIGSSCNVCQEKDSRRAAIMRFRPDGSHGEIYATGLRNTVGFDWRSGTNELYGVDNGRDFLGDDFPPCELNRIEYGKFYGWPYADGNKIADPDFGEGNQEKINNSVAPLHEFGAHTAPLGIVFLRGEYLPPAYSGAALVTLHGSWNRSKKAGYQVVSLHFHNGGTVTTLPFITGFEMNDDVIGRPVDVAEGPDGAIYVSDDHTGSIYRVVYAKPTGSSPSSLIERPN